MKLKQHIEALFGSIGEQNIDECWIFEYKWSFDIIILVLDLVGLPGATALSIAFFVIQCYSFVSVVRFSRRQLLQ